MPVISGFHVQNIYNNKLETKEKIMLVDGMKNTKNITLPAFYFACF